MVILSKSKIKIISKMSSLEPINYVIIRAGLITVSL